MKKYIFAVILASVSFVACTSAEKEATEQIEANEQTSFEVKDSELALLMREMYPDSEKLRQSILDGQVPADLRQKFAALHTASPTDSAVKTQLFASFGDSFLASMDNLYNTPTKENFNAMVAACVTCHKEYCTGPIKKIRRLEIP